MATLVLGNYALFPLPASPDQGAGKGERKDQIFFVVHPTTGETFEVVRVPIENLNPKKQSEINQELDVGKRLKSCSNLRLLVEVVTNPECVLLVYTTSRLVGRSREISLLEYVTKSGKLSEDEAKSVFVQIAQLVFFCHQNLVVLRDLKLPSILIDPVTKGVRLTDLHQASLLERPNQPLTDRKGSPAYVSPDVLVGKPFSGQKADVWSLGVVLYAMLCGNFPFSGPSPKEIFQKILTSYPVYPAYLSPQASSLLQGLLKPNASARISVVDALNHSWLSDCDDDEEQVVPDF